MSTTAQIVAILSVLASLYLVTRGFRSHGLTTGRTVQMAMIWAVIIVLGALIVRSVAG